MFYFTFDRLDRVYFLVPIKNESLQARKSYSYLYEQNNAYSNLRFLLDIEAMLLLTHIAAT